MRSFLQACFNGCRAVPVGKRLLVAMAMWGGLLLAGCDDSDSDHGTIQDGTYRITVYYTAVESYHGGALESLRGCLSQDCVNGTADLGSYPADFVSIVRTEGAGKITSGTHAGRYLHWSSDVGYWIDTAPVDAQGSALKSFETAAADSDVLARGTRFKLVGPLTQSDGTALDSSVADRFLSPKWDVQDQFSGGNGGENHIDLYIGEEDRADFTSTSPYYVELKDVKIEVF